MDRQTEQDIQMANANQNWATDAESVKLTHPNGKCKSIQLSELPMLKQ